MISIFSSDNYTEWFPNVKTLQFWTKLNLSICIWLVLFYLRFLHLCYWERFQDTVYGVVVVLVASFVQLMEIRVDINHEDPLSMGFLKWECWIGLPFPFQGIKSGSPALQVDSLQAEPPGSPSIWFIPGKKKKGSS